LTKTTNGSIPLQKNLKGGEYCMNGGIYSDQTCSLCGKRFEDNRRNALVCPEHPEQQATRFRVYFKSVSKRFKNYNEAFRFLTGLRYETDKGSFDRREYQKGLPLSFQNLVGQWLEIKKHEIKKSSYTKINGHIEKAIKFWGHKNIKEFKKRDFQLFVNSLEGLSTKTKHNHLSTVHQFFVSLYDNEDIDQIPRFPKLSFTLKRRKTTDKKTQFQILDEVWNITHNKDKKIWFAIKLMHTYINCRPGEIRSIKEKDIDLKQKRILIPDPKEKESKFIYLLDEDVEIIKSFPTALDKEMYFFRHTSGKGGTKVGDKCGEKYFTRPWNKACKKLGVEGITLYAGTRHTSATALRHKRTPEQIKAATGHNTTRSFARYFMLDEDDLRETYSLTVQEQGGKEVAKTYKIVNG